MIISINEKYIVNLIGMSTLV